MNTNPIEHEDLKYEILLINPCVCVCLYLHACVCVCVCRWVSWFIGFMASQPEWDYFMPKLVLL